MFICSFKFLQPYENNVPGFRAWRGLARAFGQEQQRGMVKGLLSSSSNGGRAPSYPGATEETLLREPG